MESQKTGSTELGERLRARRDELGISRRHLAEATGLSYPYVSQLETGYRLPSSTALRDLAAALAVSTDELVALMPAQRPGSGRPAAGPLWISNPAFQGRAPAATPAAPRARKSAASVVAESYELLSSLPPDQRLDALNKVQRALIAGLVEEQSRGDGPNPRA